MTTLSVGIHSGVAMEDYVRDRISPEPSMSTGIVQALFERSPLHAWQAHPKLGGGSDEPTNRSDIGTAIHSLVLGGCAVQFAPPEFSDWRKKDAQAFRDSVRESGGVALLEKQRAEVEEVAERAKKALTQYGAGGRTEMTMLWQDQGVWCRGRSDVLSADGKYDIDLKTSENADPSAWIRSTLVQGGYDIQAALRVRGHEIIDHRTRDVLFLLVEINPPYAISWVGVGPALIEMSSKKIDYTIKKWKECLATKTWPGYSTEIHSAEPPGFLAYQLADRGIVP